MFYLFDLLDFIVLGSIFVLFYFCPPSFQVVGRTLPSAKRPPRGGGWGGCSYSQVIHGVIHMIKSHRGSVHKGHAAKQFQHGSSMTHPKNAKMRPMRGGFRL